MSSFVKSRKFLEKSIFQNVQNSLNLPARQKNKIQKLPQLDTRKNNCIYQKLFGRTPDEFGAAF